MKAEVIAGYVARGQPEAGEIILRDTLNGTGCQFAGGGAIIVSKQNAKAKRLEVAHWRGEMKKVIPPEGQVLHVATASAKGPAGVAFLGVAAVCPA